MNPEITGVVPRNKIAMRSICKQESRRYKQGHKTKKEMLPTKPEIAGYKLMVRICVGCQ